MIDEANLGRRARPLVLLEREKPHDQRNWKLCSFMGPGCYRCAEGPCEAPAEAKTGSALRTWLREERAHDNAAFAASGRGTAYVSARGQLLQRYAIEARPNETFDDFCNRRYRGVPEPAAPPDLRAYAAALLKGGLENLFLAPGPTLADLDALAARSVGEVTRRVLDVLYSPLAPEQDGDVTAYPPAPRPTR